MNGSLLRSEMVLQNISQNEMAKRIGLSRSAFYRKLNGTTEFNRDEIAEIKSVLHLNDEKLVAIFFTPRVS